MPFPAGIKYSFPLTCGVARTTRPTSARIGCACGRPAFGEGMRHVPTPFSSSTKSVCFALSASETRAPQLMSNTHATFSNGLFSAAIAARNRVSSGCERVDVLLDVPEPQRLLERGGQRRQPSICLDRSSRGQPVPELLHVLHREIGQRPLVPFGASHRQVALGLGNGLHAARC